MTQKLVAGGFKARHAQFGADLIMKAESALEIQAERIEIEDVQSLSIGPKAAQFDKTKVALFTSASSEGAMKQLMDLTDANKENVAKKTLH